MATQCRPGRPAVRLLEASRAMQAGSAVRLGPVVQTVRLGPAVQAEQS